MGPSYIYYLKLFLPSKTIIQTTRLIPYNRELPKISMNPRIRLQKASNLGTCLDFLKKENIRLENCGPEDIVDKNTKIVLGLIWILILRYFELLLCQCALGIRFKLEVKPRMLLQ
jgi:hypothetical protein